MKRIAIFVLSIMLLVTVMATPVFATTDGGNAAVSSASGKPGETVYLTVSLSDFEKADTIGVKISLSEGLKLDIQNSQWQLDGILADIDSNNNAVWCASDDAVDVNGDIMTLAVTIPASAAGNTVYDVTCSVTATKDGQAVPETAAASGKVIVSIPATGLTLSDDALELVLTQNESATLTATVTPENTTDAVVWSSSDESVATVDQNGVVTAKKAGAAVITAKAGKYTAQCDVSVKFNLAGTNVVLGSTLDLNFFINKSDLDGTDYYAIITHHDHNQEEPITVKVPYSQWGVRSTLLSVTLPGLAARQMADQVDVTIYNGKDVAVSTPKTDSIKGYAMRILPSQKDVVKTVLADMLNYGAAAQVYFDYNTEDLANNQLGDYQKFATTDAEMSSRIKNTPTRVLGANNVGATLTLKDRIMLTFYFSNITPDMYAVATYTDHHGDSYSLKIDGSKFSQYNATTYGVVIDQLLVADGDTFVTVKVYNKSGKEVASGSDCINGYAFRNMSNIPLSNPIAKFTFSSYDYLHQ